MPSPRADSATVMQQRRFGNLVFTPDDGRLRRAGGESEVGLRPQAGRVLECLLDSAGEVVSRDRLIQAVWGEQAVVDFDAGLAALMRELRGAIRSVGGPDDLIETVPRRGYRLREDAEPARCRHRTGSRPTRHLLIAAAVVVLLAVATATWWLVEVSAPPERTPAAACSLAILPFEIYDPVPGLPEHAELLLADRLLAALLREPVERMSLIGRTSLRPYVDRSDVASAVAEDLDVDMLIEGSVQAAAGGWRVQARLLLVPPGRVIWSQEVAVESGREVQLGAVARPLAESLSRAWPGICGFQ